MKIRFNQAELEVYGLYWSEHDGVRQRFHLVVPKEGYPGLTIVLESECEVIDPSFSKWVLIKDPNSQDVLIHAALQQNGLLERMIEHEPGAADEFLRLVEL